MSEVFAFVLGVLSVAIGVYIRRAFQEALERRKVALQLEAYLNRWLEEVLDNDDLLNLLTWGESWRQKKIEAYEKGRGDFEEELDKQRSEMEDIKERISEKGIDTEVMEDLENMKSFEIRQQIDHLRDQRQLILDNKIFLSDREVVQLPWATAQRAMKVKMSILSVLETSILLLKYVRDTSDIEENKVRDGVHSVLKEFIKLGQNFIPLHDDARRISQQNVIRVAMNWG